MLKVKLQKSPKYSHFRILPKAAERLGIFSIPVRGTRPYARKQRKYVVSGFFFYSENPLCSLSVLYFENAEFWARFQAPFGSFSCLRDRVLSWRHRRISPVLLPTYDSKYYSLLKLSNVLTLPRLSRYPRHDWRGTMRTGDGISAEKLTAEMIGALKWELAIIGGKG